MTSRAPTTQRSLFCECNKTLCVCWPSTSSTRPRTRSRPQQPSAAVATAWPHYEAAPAQQLPSPHTPSGSHTSPVVRPRPSSLTVPANNAVPTSPTTATSPRSPRMNQLQLHGLFKAPSILRTPESPSAFRIRWDVRDASTASVLVSNHEPEHLYAHPASVAYATSPPVPFLMVAYDGALPWLAPVHAQPGSAGVTVRDVLDAVSAVLHTQVDKDTLRQLPTDEARECVYQAYYGRVERNGADNRGILAVDFLGDKSLFVSLERDEALTRKRVKEEHLWPYVFALKLKLRKGALVSDA